MISPLNEKPGGPPVIRAVEGIYFWLQINRKTVTKKGTNAQVLKQYVTLEESIMNQARHIVLCRL